MNEYSEMIAKLPWRDIGASVIIVAAILMARWGLYRAIRGKSETLTPEQRRWIAATRSGAAVLIVLALLFVWSLELSRFALSIAAFAVAIVIASKEIILCVSGGLYRAVSSAFNTGDWIEVGAYRGEVLQKGLLTTTLQELAPDSDLAREYTGRTVTMPNALLLSHPIINLNFMRRFNYYNFEITVPEGDVAPEADLAFLNECLDGEWSQHADVAERYWSMVRQRTGIDLRQPTPRVAIKTTELCHICFNVRIFCPREQAGDVQRRVTLAFLERIDGRRHADEEKS